MQPPKIVTRLSLVLTFFLLTCCSQNNISKSYKQTQLQLEAQLQNPDLSTETQFGIINQIAKNMHAVKDYHSLILFLTSWVEKHETDPYNAYWLLMTANAYLETDAAPVASYYFERIIRNYPDLIVQEKSIHFLSLQQLIQISTEPANRIKYFNQLITQFPNDVSITEMYYRLALEYEKEGEWAQAIRTYTLFVNRDDAATIQIPDIPNAYQTAKQLIDFNKSSKDWTFETIDDLTAAIKNAISSYDYRKLDSYKSKVNFFAMSWQQDENADNAQSSFSMRSYMRGNKIHYENDIDSISSPTEAYLRTWGWNSYIHVWYLYFRKVNFPADPEIHGRWEWAGIYYGEKL
ncbi:MAG: tetratricopeptide repeat protein [Treponema sp.]|nr:tetratricopeptide repeat protein [Treponema sp.]